MDLIPLYTSNIKNILVIGGGGLKGFAALGLCTYLYENEILKDPDIYCGTSVGAMLVSMLAVGLKPIEIYKLLYKVNFENIVTPDYEKFLFEPEHYGLSSIENMIKIVEICFEKKGHSKNITFKEFYDKTRKKIIVSGTNVNKYRVEYFSVDTYPDKKIIDAVQISASVPMIIEPFKIEKHNENTEFWVDGGLMDNYPIQLFNDRLDDVIGIYTPEGFGGDALITGHDSYMMALLKCFSKGSNFYKLEIYKNQTIVINCDFEQNIYFKISHEDKKRIYDIGYNAGVEHYK